MKSNSDLAARPSYNFGRQSHCSLVSIAASALRDKQALPTLPWNLLETTMSALPPNTVPLTPAKEADGPPTTLKYTRAAPHPVEQLEAGRMEGDLRSKRALQAATYGSAFPMRRMMQESVLGQFHRLPGLPSSGLAVERLRGRGEDMDFQDFLNLPQDCPEGGFGGDGCGLGASHEAMEKKLGIAPKAPF